jgi:hypothetical protein
MSYPTLVCLSLARFVLEDYLVNKTNSLQKDLALDFSLAVVSLSQLRS